MRTFLSLRIPHVTTEIIVVLKDVLRKYPTFIDDFVPYLVKLNQKYVSNPEGRLSFVWILGQFGERIEESPYILEKIMYEEKNFGDTKLTSALLTAILKLFFKRAPEMKQILSIMMQMVLIRCPDADIKARATMYMRILHESPEAAEKIVLGEEKKTIVDSYFEDKNEYINNQLFMEFNTLSVPY